MKTRFVNISYFSTIKWFHRKRKRKIGWKNLAFSLECWRIFLEMKMNRIHFINFLQGRNEIRMNPRHRSRNVILFNGNFAGGGGKENHFERHCLIAGTLNNNCSKPSAEFSKARVRTLLIRLRRRRFSRRRLIESVFTHKEAALLFEIRGVIILI